MLKFFYLLKGEKIMKKIIAILIAISLATFLSLSNAAAEGRRHKNTKGTMTGSDNRNHRYTNNNHNNNRNHKYTYNKHHKNRHHRYNAHNKHYYKSNPRHTYHNRNNHRMHKYYRHNYCHDHRSNGYWAGYFIMQSLLCNL